MNGYRCLFLIISSVYVQTQKKKLERLTQQMQIYLSLKSEFEILIFNLVQTSAASIRGGTLLKNQADFSPHPHTLQ